MLSHTLRDGLKTGPGSVRGGSIDGVGVKQI